MIHFQSGNLFKQLATTTHSISAHNFYEHIRNILLQAHQNILQHPLAGFYNLPTQANSIAAKIQAHWPQQKFGHYVVLGIGGSSLGPRVIAEVAQYLQHEKPLAHANPDFTVIDHLDPITFARVTHTSKLANTLFIIISKSGSTTETLAAYSAVHKALQVAQLPPANHLLFMTSEPKSPLAQIAKELQAPVVALPTNVGGRFCILGEIGAVSSLCCAGTFDYTQLSAGANDLKARIEEEINFLKNNTEFNGGISELLHQIPITFAGAIFNDVETLLQHNVHTLFIYHEYLKTFGLWFVQLFGESLGKKAANGHTSGLFPSAASGPADQHSLLQYLMEGHQKVLTGFVKVNEGRELKLHPPLKPTEHLSLLEGVGLHELTNIELESTFQSLLETKKTCYKLELDRLDEKHLGELFFMMEYWAAQIGFAQKVDPFEQPGVELSKVYIRERLKNRH